MHLQERSIIREQRRGKICGCLRMEQCGTRFKEWRWGCSRPWEQRERRLETLPLSTIQKPDFRFNRFQENKLWNITTKQNVPPRPKRAKGARIASL